MTSETWERVKPKKGEKKLITYIAPHQKRETKWHEYQDTRGKFAHFKDLTIHISKILFVQ